MLSQGLPGKALLSIRVFTNFLVSKGRDVAIFSAEADVDQPDLTPTGVFVGIASGLDLRHGIAIAVHFHDLEFHDKNAPAKVSVPLRGV